MENSWEGERRRYFSDMSEAGEGDLEKKRRPSVVGCVKAERREDTWWRTGVEVVSNDWDLPVDVVCASVWTA